MLRAGEFLGRPVRATQSDGLTLTLYDYAASCSLPVHDHESAYLSLPLAGEYEERTSAAARTCAAGRALFHPPGETHRDVFSRAGATIFSVEIGGAWLERLRDVGFATGERREVAAGVFVPARRFLHGETIDAVELLAALHPSRRSSPPAWLERVRQALHDSPSQPPLASLARIAGVHEVHLARTFRAVHGCTIGEYCRTIRLGRALGMLRNPNFALADVALACGYADQSHLCRDVKRATGTTPARLRRR